MLLPFASRLRVYIVGVRKDGSATSMEPDDFFNKFGCVLEALKTEALPVDKVLLPSDHPYLKGDLQRRLDARKEQDEKDADDDGAKECFGVGTREARSNYTWEVINVFS